MTTIGIIGAGEVGSQIARAALATGYKVVIANSRGPETLESLIAELGPSVRAAYAADAAAAGDFAVVAVPLKLVNDMPVDGLAGKIVLDTNNYMVWRDGNIPVVDSGEKNDPRATPGTALDFQGRQGVHPHPGSPAPHLWSACRRPRPVGTLGIERLPRSRQTRDATIRPVRFDTVDNSPLSESWRTGPGQPAWIRHAHQNRDELALNLRRARRVIQA